MGRLGRLIATVLATLVLSTGLLVGPMQASACACGAVAADASVKQETAVLRWHGDRQTIDMVMRLDGPSRDAGWIMPTPRDAKLELGSRDLFQRVATASLPEYRRRTVFRPTLKGLLPSDGRSGAESAVSEARVRVLATTQVGPFEVTTITGSDAAGVDTWLTSHGYPSRPDLVPTFRSYLQQGWVLQAVKLVPAEKDSMLGNELPPLRMTWKADRPTYPIRLSSHATVKQHVTLYLVSSTPLEMATQAAPRQPLNLYYSGTVAAERIDPTLSTDLHLSVYEGDLTPDRITQDYTFRENPTMADHRTVIWFEDNVFPDVAKMVFWLLMATGIAVVSSVLIKRARRPAPRP